VSRAKHEKRRARERAAHEARMARIRRTRTIVGVLGLIPLLGSVGCEGAIALACAVPREAYLAGWAAVFGAFVGLSIRLVRERRRYEQRTTGG
jgi:ABC-type nickel/cobalt efflux system permease component RcnA